MTSLTLNNGISMPQQGLGVFQTPDAAECRQSVLSALETGYRLIDTAACYGNERAVGEAVKRSGLPREAVFLTSKVWIQDAGYEKTLASFEKTLDNLGTDYLDLYLIHMPYGDYHGSWRAMETLLQAGRVRAIGVCNFLPDRLVDLILTHSVVPAVNQIELHPFCQQQALRQVMAAYHIQPMAWAPFAEGQGNLFHHPVLSAIGQAHGKTPTCPVPGPFPDPGIGRLRQHPSTGGRQCRLRQRPLGEHTPNRSQRRRPGGLFLRHRQHGRGGPTAGRPPLCRSLRHYPGRALHRG